MQLEQSKQIGTERKSIGTLKKYFNPVGMASIGKSVGRDKPARRSFRSASTSKKGRLTRYIIGDNNKFYVSRVSEKYGYSTSKNMSNLKTSDGVNGHTPYRLGNFSEPQFKKLT